MAVETRLEAIEADDLIASSRDDLSPDSRYDAELQPRGRETQATEARVSGVLENFDPERLGDSVEAQTGAPIVARNDNLVESGNARTLAIRRAGRVAPEKAKAYRDWLTANAESMGLDPAAVGAMKNPVLVRRRLTDLTREERLRFTREANEDIVNRQSAAQQAKLDRDRITPQMLAALDPSDALGGKKNQGFVGAFMEAVPKTERGQLIGSDGTVSADGIARIERAVLAKAYGDTPTTRSIIDGNTETHRNIKRAMTDAAPRMARLNDAVTKGDRFELGLADELSATAAKLESLREQGMSVDQYVNQQTRLPGTETPDALLADAMLLGVDAHKRAPNRLAGILERYADLVDDAGNPKQTTMFGAAEPPSKLDLWERARRAEEVAHVEKELTPLQKKLDEASAAAAATGKPAPSAKAVLGADAKKYERMRQLKDDLEQGKPIDEASRKFQERGEMEKNPLLREQIAERQAAPKPVAKPEVKPEVKAKPSADFQPNQAVEFSTPTGPKRGKVLSTEGNFVRVQPDDFGVVLKVSKLRVKAISGNGAAASTPVSKTVDAGSSPAPRATIAGIPNGLRPVTDSQGNVLGKKHQQAHQEKAKRNVAIVERIKDALAQGNKLHVRTGNRVTPISSPDHIKVDSYGDVRVIRGGPSGKFDVLVGDSLKALEAEAAKKAAPKPAAKLREPVGASATPNVSDPRAGALRLRSRDPVAQAQAEAARTEPNPEGTVRVVRKGRERVARLFRPGERPRTKLHQMIDDAIEAAKGAWESLPSKSELKQQLISSASVIEEFVGPAKAKLGDRDPYAARRLFEGSIGKAEQIIDTELAPILGRVRKETNDVIELGVLERMDELTRVKGVKKLPDGLTPLEVNAWKDRTRDRLKREGKFDRVDQALKELRDFSRAQLRRLRHAGIISAEQYNEIVRTNQAYIPMMRIGYLTNDGPNAHIPARKFSVAGQDVLHKIVGSARELADPLESMVRNVYKAQALIDRNQVAAKLFDLQKLPEFAGQVVPLKKGQDAPRGFGAVKFYRQGEIQRYAVPERIAESMHGLGRHQSDLITRAATLGSRALRAGATGLNAVFIPPNAARDFKTLAVTQHMGVAETTYTWLSGMAEVIGRGRYYDEWARAGGSFSGFFDSMRGPRRTLGSITQSRAEKVARTVVNPLELVRLTGEIIEQAPRVGAFKRARTKLGESSAQAALRSRDATVDFAKVGESVRLLNMWVPFLNARLQGTINIAEAFREDPVRAMWAAGQVAIAPALATYYWNHANFPDVMEEIQDWEKETSTILIYGREKDKDGRYTQAVKFPRSEVDKALGSPLEAFLDYLHERDGVGWAELGLRVMSDISPVAFERDGHLSMTRLLGDILPPTLKAGAEVATETSFFTGRRIIPRNLEKAAPRDQYRADTPSAAVAIGQAVNISPMLVQQAIRSQFGAVGEQALRLASGDDPGIKRGIGRRFSGVSGGAKEDRWFRDMDAIDRKLESGKAEARRRATVLYDQLQAAPKADRAGLLRTAVTDAAAAGGRDAAQLLIDQLRTESIRRSESAALRSLRNRSVEGRAQFLKDEMQRMAPGERGAFLRDMEAARVLTPTVAEELRRLP
jgi:hypothetical protein